MLVPKTLRLAALREARRDDDKDGKRVIKFMDRLVDVWGPAVEAQSRNAAGYFEHHKNLLKNIWEAIPKSEQAAETYRRKMREVVDIFFVCTELFVVIHACMSQLVEHAEGMEGVADHDLANFRRMMPDAEQVVGCCLLCDFQFQSTIAHNTSEHNQNKKYSSILCTEEWFWKDF